MKITLNELRKIIKEQLLQEQIFGNLAFVYHGSKTAPDQMLDLINNKKFDPGLGAGAMYGPGFYTVREFEPDLQTFNGTYGPYVYKFKANLAGVVSFDSDVTTQIYGKQLSIIEQIQLIINKNLVDQRKAEKLNQFLKLNENGFLNQKEYQFQYSSAAALKNWKDLITAVKGISFTGQRDGPVIVFYSLDGIVPVAWAQTGKNKNKEDYKWNAFKISSLDQSFDYRKFNKINYDFESTQIKKIVKKIQNTKNVEMIIYFLQNASTEMFLKYVWEFYKFENEKNKNDFRVQREIAMRSDCPEQILKKLAFHESPEIREYVAENASTPTEALLELAADIDDTVANIAIKMLDYHRKNYSNYDYD